MPEALGSSYRHARGNSRGTSEHALDRRRAGDRRQRLHLDHRDQAVSVTITIGERPTVRVGECNAIGRAVRLSERQPKCDAGRHRPAIRTDARGDPDGRSATRLDRGIVRDLQHR